MHVSRRHLIGIGLTGLLAPWTPARGRAETSLHVGDGRELMQALAGARAGTEIVLADGTYSGSFVLDAAGTAERPVVVRAANPLGARIASPIRMLGSHGELQGLDIDGAPVLIEGAANLVRRCRHRHGQGICLHLVRGPGHRLLDGEVADWAGLGVSIKAWACREPVIRGYLFRDTPRGYRKNGSEALQIGQGQADFYQPLKALVERCRIVGWNSDDEAISVKSSGNTLRQIVLERCQGRVQNRGGRHNSYEALWLRGCWSLRIHDADNRVLGCRLEQSLRHGIAVAAGSAEPGTAANREHNLAANTVVAGCDADRTIVGAAYTGQRLPARNTRIRQHAGPIAIVPELQVDTDSRPDEPEQGLSWPEPVWLADRDVGPWGGSAAAPSPAE
jgi:hypothetical protein